MPTTDVLKRRAQASKRWRDKHPEQRREVQRRSAAKAWADPVRRTIRLNRHRDWWYRNHDREKQKMRDRTRKRRERILMHYGGKCVCCGEPELSFLTLDHPNGNGTQHRNAVGFGANFYVRLEKDGLPPDYRVLCANCNMAWARECGCPHQNEKKVAC